MGERLMPLYQYACPQGHEVEKVLQIAERNDPGPCGACGGVLERVWRVRGRNAQAFDPIVLHRSPDGKYSFPMHHSEPPLDGYERIECGTFQELDRHIKQANAVERRKMEAHVESQREQLNYMESVNRSELRDRMRHMQPVWRGFAELAMRENDKKPRPKVSDPNVYAEIRDFDASNRMEHRDLLTGWKRRNA
jgi:hypothetical protein